MIVSETIQHIRRTIKDKQLNKLGALVPGRKLDALVAHYVMGYHVEQWLAEDGGDLDYWYRDSVGLHAQDPNDLERVPNYSTMIYSAVSILTRFKVWHIHGDDATGIRVWFTEGVSGHPLNMACRTLPEAICKGALAALIEQNRIMEELLND